MVAGRVFAALAAVLLAVAGCVEQGPPPLTQTQSFNPADVAWASKPGKNAVTGHAVLRTVGGEARTCAALPVQLIPDSSYARERMLALYGSIRKGTRQAAGASRFERTDPEYISSSRQTRCDGQGYFSFDDVPDGVWYVTAVVVWQAPGNPAPQGGAMMERIELAGGKTVKVALP